MGNRFGFTVDICNTCKGFICVNFSYVLEEEVINYDPEDFYNCRVFVLNKNTLLNKHRFNGTQKYLVGASENINQPTEYFGY